LTRCLHVGATAGWYENGGLVQSIFTLIAADALGSVMRIIQIPPLFRRFVLAPCLSQSQQQANKLWEPELMFVGELYANALKTFAIAVLYQPVWPLVPFLVPVGLLVAYLCFNFAIVFWWRPPPDLSDELLQRLRGWVLAVLIVRFGIELWVDSQARPETKRGALLVVAESAARCAVQVALVLAFCVCPWGRFTALRRWRHDETATNSKPYEAQQDTLDKYDCPAVGPTRSAFALEKAHEKRLVGLDLTTAAYKNMAATLTTSWA
jgi:hypothetical protein